MRSLLKNAATRDRLKTQVASYFVLDFCEWLTKLILLQVVFPVTVCRVTSELSDLVQDFPVTFVSDIEVVGNVLELLLLLIA